MAIFMVMLMGIMSAFTGKTWSMIMKREREKELLFRGSQIKEAIENWYNPKYSVQGAKWQGSPHPLMDLKDLLQNPHTLQPLKYLPQSYAAEVDDTNPKCVPDCAKIKLLQDPITGKEWTIIRGNYGGGKLNPQGVGIIGVASKSEETPLRTDFKDTALENMLSEGDKYKTNDPNNMTPTTPTTPDSGSSNTKYSDWKFIAVKDNDHSKLYRAYHEGW